MYLTRGYIGLRGARHDMVIYIRRHWATQSYMRQYTGLHEATLSYMSQQRVTLGCTELHEVTLGLQKVIHETA